MAKFYAVKEGKKPGIYMSWDECKEQVNGYSGAVYKSFTSEDEAKAFIGKEVKKVSDDLTLLAYVDGSYNIKTKEYGYGCVLIEGQQVIQQLLGKGNIPEYSSMRNVSGEILGCMKAIAYAIDLIMSLFAFIMIMKVLKNGRQVYGKQIRNKLKIMLKQSMI